MAVERAQYDERGAARQSWLVNAWRDEARLQSAMWKCRIRAILEDEILGAGGASGPVREETARGALLAYRRASRDEIPTGWPEAFRAYWREIRGIVRIGWDPQEGRAIAAAGCVSGAAAEWWPHGAVRR